MENLNTPDVEALSLLQSTGNAFALASRGILPIINLFDAAQQLTDAKLPHIATQLYQVWLERTDSQIAYAAQFNLGVILSNINDDAGAEAAYRAAISEKPSFVLAYLNLGTLLECTGRSEDAVSVWRNALAFVDMDTPDGPALYVQILNNLGRIQETRGESDQSATDIMSNGDFGAGDASVQVKAYSHLLKQASSLKKVLAVYTVLLGDKECLGDPLLNLLPGSSSDLDIEFICFTDNHSYKSDTWKFEYIDSHHLPADKLSRRPKALPHEYLKQYDVSLYIDNIVTFKRLPNSHDLGAESPYLFRVFPHANRQNLIAEADAIAILGYENIDVICQQLDFYAQLRPLETITPISTCSVILRSHHHPKLVEFGVIWWEEILNFSKRDQLSFDFTVSHTGCQINYLHGLIHDNDLIHETHNMNDRRIKANFDSVKYAWLNRHDPSAKSNPKAHFLANPLATGSNYTRRPALFDYICHKAGSSLGNLIAPRRAVATTLNEILFPYQDSTGKMLLVHIEGDKSPLGFLQEEFASAVSSFGYMLNSYSGNWIELATNLPDLSFMGAEPNYDVLVLFGLPPDCCYSFIKKCASILNHSGGLIIALLTGEGDLAHIKETQNLLFSRFAAECKVSVSHSRHDDINHLISNSLICFEWKSRLVNE